MRIRDWTGSNFGDHVYALRVTYDLDGRRTSLHHPAALAPAPGHDSVTYAYGPAGRLTTVSGLLSNTFSFGYDAAGRLIHRTLPGSITESRGYDADDRLIWRTLNGANFQGKDRRLGTEDSLTTLIQQDTMHYGGRAKVLGVITLGDSIAAHYTGLGALSRMARGEFPRTAGGVIPPVRQHVEQYTPDALAQHATASFGDVARAYHYNRTAGRLSSTSTSVVYEGGLGYLADTSSYDAAGNLDVLFRTEVVPRVSEGTYMLQTNTHYYYDALGHLRVVDRRTNWGPDILVAVQYAGAFEEMRYDALGRRILLRVRRDSVVYNDGQNNLGKFSTIERYAWDGSALLYEMRYSGSDTASAAELERDTATVGTQHFFFCQPNQCVDTTYTPYYGRVAYTYGLALDQPLSLVRIGYGHDSTLLSPLTIIPHYDWRGQADKGTRVSGTDISIAVPNIEWIDRRTSAFLNDQPPENPQNWMGDLLLGQPNGSGLLYRRNRYYDPQSGRFTQEDPIGLAGGLNLYGYAAGDPVNYSDPFGLSACRTNEYLCLIARAGWQTVGGLLGGIGGAGVGFGASLACLEACAVAVVPATSLAGAAAGIAYAGSKFDNIWESRSQGGNAAGNGDAARPERQRLSAGEIKKLKEAGLDPEELKEFDGKADLFKDKKGDIFVHPKNGSGPGDPTGYNIYNLPKP